MTHPLQALADNMREDARRAATLKNAVDWIERYALVESDAVAEVLIAQKFSRGVAGSHEAAGVLSSHIQERLNQLWRDALIAARAELEAIEGRYRSLLHPPSSE